MDPKADAEQREDTERRQRPGLGRQQTLGCDNARATLYIHAFMAVAQALLPWWQDDCRPRIHPSIHPSNAPRVKLHHHRPAPSHLPHPEPPLTCAPKSASPPRLPQFSRPRRSSPGLCAARHARSHGTGGETDCLVPARRRQAQRAGCARASTGRRGRAMLAGETRT